MTDTTPFYRLATVNNPSPRSIHSAVAPPSERVPAPTMSLALSVLAWPAWLRVLVVLPVLALLWLAVGWASADVMAP